MDCTWPTLQQGREAYQSTGRLCEARCNCTFYTMVNRHSLPSDRVSSVTVYQLGHQGHLLPTVTSAQAALATDWQSGIAGKTQFANCSTVTGFAPGKRFQATSSTTPPTIAATHIPAAASPAVLLPPLAAGDGALAGFDTAAVLAGCAARLPAPATAGLDGCPGRLSEMLPLGGAEAVAKGWDKPGAVGRAAPSGPSLGLLTPAHGADTVGR